MAIPLRSCNHLSVVVADVDASVAFYRDLLGFAEIQRPSAFRFDGSWLYGYGIGLHLIEGSPVARPAEIDPKADHISFVSDDLAAVAAALAARGVPHRRATVLERGVRVEQIFFHDPDNFMVEVCNCDALPVCPAAPRAPRRGGSSASSDAEESTRLDGAAAALLARMSFESLGSSGAPAQ